MSGLTTSASGSSAGRSFWNLSWESGTYRDLPHVISEGHTCQRNLVISGPGVIRNWVLTYILCNLNQVFFFFFFFTSLGLAFYSEAWKNRLDSDKITDMDVLREINTKSTRTFVRSCDGCGQWSRFQPGEAGRTKMTKQMWKFPG